MTHRNRPTGKPRVQSDHLSAPVNCERQEHRTSDLRASIANSAARLVAEGQTDFHAAKRKAARQHGITDGHALPDNHEIESALRQHLALFAREIHPRVLSALRDTALRLMSNLEQFSPWLAGGVLNGTANQFSDIELEIIGVEPKDFEMYLLNAGVEFELCHTQHPRRASPTRKPPEIKYRLEFDGAQVTIALYDHHAARQGVTPRGSLRHDRVQRADAEGRFVEENSKS